MPKYRKRPVVVEAEQYWPDKPLPKGVHVNSYQFATSPHYVLTIHGQQAYLKPGDWVIAEPDGEHYYPCKPEIFAATYEPVDD